MLNLGDEQLLSQFRDHNLVDDAGNSTGARIKLQVIRQEASNTAQGSSARTGDSSTTRGVDTSAASRSSGKASRKLGGTCTLRLDRLFAAPKTSEDAIYFARCGLPNQETVNGQAQERTDSK